MLLFKFKTLFTTSFPFLANERKIPIPPHRLFASGQWINRRLFISGILFSAFEIHFQLQTKYKMTASITDCFRAKTC